MKSLGEAVAMNRIESRLRTQVLIIGGGITGVGLSRDLALRGVQCVVVEKGHVDSGASGANHGLLHSGARYVSNDPATARECRSESEVLKRMAPACCETTGGLFVAVPGDDEAYVAEFPGLCESNGISAQAIDCREARDLEPELSENIIAAFQVDDATVDPFRLSFDNISDAVSHGARLMTYTEAVAMVREGRRIRSVRLRQLRSGREIEVEADQVVNAGGAWVGRIAALAGLKLSTVWSKGSLLITQPRITDRVINRLRPPADGDIIVPGGTVSLVGTTSVRVHDIDHLHAELDEVDFLVEEASRLVPSLQSTRLVRAFAGVRPLLGRSTAGDDRSIGRGSELLGHEEEGLDNLLTVVGGKLTMYRLTAEMVADLICSRLGISSPCLTRDLPLPKAPVNDWVVAGLSPGLWRQHRNPGDALLCECEMVPMSAVEQIVHQLHIDGETVDLEALRLHSRMGKGSCQGAFCGLRTAGFLYERGIFVEDQGIEDIRTFLESRWKGLRPVLWGRQLIQEQLQEAIHCGLFSLETRIGRMKADSDGHE
ncbi:MAG: anaerobic glycerol-3-phosphate dehydrogenase subunit A [Syntrophobacteraceae bacterium]